MSDISQLFQAPAGLFLLYSDLSGDGYPAVACQLWKTKRAKPPACCVLPSNVYLMKLPENIALPEQGDDGGGGSVRQSSFL